MIRFLSTVTCLAALSNDAFAAESVVRLTVQPMPAPEPALKYLLLPEVGEMNPGNPAQYYLRCFAEQRNFFFSKEAAAQRAGYLTAPLADLVADKLRNYGGSALTQADWAARLDAIDWQVLQRVQADGLDLHLPELEPFRILAKALQARFRIAVAGRRFDEAIQNIKTMFAFARHLGEHPTLAANRVGLEVANRAIDTLQEMLQQPGCPNLYWALTDLPMPLVDIRKGLQGERLRTVVGLRAIRSDETMTDQQIDAIVGRFSGMMSFAREEAGLPPRNLRAELTARTKDQDQLRAARDRLLSTGCAEKKLQAFPPLQIILLDEKRAFENRCEEDMKLLGLAPWQIDQMRASEHSKPNTGGLFANLLTDVVKIRQAQAQLERRLALVRHVEALRLHAARAEGKLPEKLSDLGLPLPNDPFTGKPFSYKREGETAHLLGRPAQASPEASDDLHWEISIKK